mgnify:CR=1 FL=1
MNPFQLYWTEQHQQGDVDNLQMGFDFDFIKGTEKYGLESNLNASLLSEKKIGLLE